MQQFFFSLRSFSILNLNIIYELNNWPKNPSNNFTLKECFIMHSQIIKKSNYKYFFNDQAITFDVAGE